MVASFHKALALSLLTAVCSSSLAEGSKAVTSAAIDLARQNLLQTLPALEAAISLCDERRKTLSIPLSSEIGVSREDLLLAISYFYFRNENHCIENAAKDFLLAARIIELAPGGDTQGSEAPQELEFVDLVVEAWWKELEAQVKYRSNVPKEHQIAIERIPGLDQPFDLIRSWEASGN